jgi:hypothetical protein
VFFSNAANIIGLRLKKFLLGIMSSRYAAIGTATAGEQELAGPLVGGLQIVIDGLAGLIAQFKPDRPSCFLLPDGCSIRCVAAGSDILDCSD